jgi:hypothetical protein
MTREEAKELLSALRPHGTDAADPVFREALELASKDSDLGAWLARQQEFDQMLIEELSSIRPPEGLRETILQSLRKTARPLQFWRNTWPALAAAVVLVAFFLSQQVVTLRNPSSRFQSFCSEALAMVAVRPVPKLDLETASLGITQAFIQQREAPQLGRFPLKLQAMATAGCRVFVWRQHLASLTCFRLPSGTLLHLVVIDEKALEDPKLPSGLLSENGWHMMFEKKNGLIVMWASQAPMDELKQVLVET